MSEDISKYYGNGLIAKVEFQEVLSKIDQALDEATKNLNQSKKSIRACYTKYAKSIIQFDIKSKDLQIAYLVKSNPDYIALFDALDDNQSKVNRLQRQREDFLKLMSFSQSEMKIL